MMPSPPSSDSAASITDQPSWLEIVGQELGGGFGISQIESLKKGPSGNEVYRVVLEDSPGFSSIVLKSFAPVDDLDPWRPDRERFFYDQIYPQIKMPKVPVLFTALHEPSGRRVVAMEDLTTTHLFPTHPFRWSQDELRAALRSYARLHDQGIDYFKAHSAPEWLLSPNRMRRGLEAVPASLGQLEEAGRWQGVDRFDVVLDYVLREGRALSGGDPTLLHADTVPTNIALPVDPNLEAILIDWEDAGWGMPELDLAYLDLQPFGSARDFKRTETLEYYWSHRRKGRGVGQLDQKKLARQRYADALRILSLLPMAAQVAQHPYPAGSYAAEHWDSLFEILYQRLNELTTEVVA